MSTAAAAERVRAYLDARREADPVYSEHYGVIDSVPSRKGAEALTEEDLHELVDQKLNLTTLADLAALPEGTVIIDAHQDVWRKYYKHDHGGGDTWYGMASNPGPYHAHPMMLPARVIA